MTAVHSHSMNQKVKKRAELALNDDFLRNAVRFTTERLRNGKRVASEQHGNWEEWRERGRQIRLHTIAHLDYYLNLFVENARANGVHIHFADTAADAVRITLDIAAHSQARSVVKSKSMVSEELHLNQALEGAGIETIESDLGEYIIQLAGEPRLISSFRRFTKTVIRLPSCYPKKQGRNCPRIRRFWRALSAKSCVRSF